MYIRGLIPRYQSRSSMYIHGLIPLNFTELAEAVPIVYVPWALVFHKHIVFQKKGTSVKPNSTSLINLPLFAIPILYGKML